MFILHSVYFIPCRPLARQIYPKFPPPPKWLSRPLSGESRRLNLFSEKEEGKDKGGEENVWV